MFRRKNKPTSDQLEVKDDVQEAIALRQAATEDLRVIKMSAQMFSRLTEPMIDRQGKNQYIETLFHHYPRSIQ